MLAQPEALRLTALLVAQLRFSRLLRTPGAEAEFDVDPAGFTARFRAWHREVPPSTEPEIDARRVSRGRGAVGVVVLRRMGFNDARR